MSEKIIERVAEAPAVILDKTLESSKKITDTISNQAHLKKAKEYWHNLGPGLTTGAADDDPSGIATYSQTGAQYGFQLIWLAGFTYPLMSVVQEMCARLGLVTGRGLAGNIRAFFPKWVLLITTFLLFFANTLNIGANLGAMAKSSQLLYPEINFGFLVIGFTILSLALQIFTTYEKYAGYLKWLALVLIAYIFSALSVDLDFRELLKFTFIPSMEFSKDQIFIVTAILGTTISPYLFFWQTSQEVEEQILEGKTTLKLRQAETTPEEVKNMRIDVWSGMFLSNLVMYFIIAACADNLFKIGIPNIATAEQAAKALQPIAGDGAYLLFALGIIGTGMLAVPVLAGSASYALSESFGWRYGLYKKLKEAYAFYGVIILAMVLGVIMNFVGIDPIKSLIYTAIANGLIAPIILSQIVLMSSNKKIMGNWTNGLITRIIGWSITLIMTVAGIATLISFF